MDIKEQLNSNLKSAMLAGEKEKVTVLRGLKSAILYAEVSLGARDKGLTDDEVISVLRKESKKRQESADLYKQGGNKEKQEAEIREKAMIDEYLPAQISEAAVLEMVDEAVAELGNDTKRMGQIIGKVKSLSDGNADGALIARLVKERLAK